MVVAARREKGELVLCEMDGGECTVFVVVKQDGILQKVEN